MSTAVDDKAYQQLKHDCVVNNLYIRSVETKLRAMQVNMDKSVEAKTRDLVAELDGALHREMEKLGVKLIADAQTVVDPTLEKVKAENDRLRSEFVSIKETEEKLVGIIDRLTREVVQVREELTAVRRVTNTTENDLATTNVAIAANRQADRREREDRQREIIQLIQSKEGDLRNMHKELVEKMGNSITGNLYAHLEKLLQLDEFQNPEVRDVINSTLSADQRLKRLESENAKRATEIDKVRRELLSETGHLMNMLSQAQNQRRGGFGRR